MHANHFSHVQLFVMPWTVAGQAPLSMVFFLFFFFFWDIFFIPSKNTGVGCHSLLQGIFLTQGSNLYLLCLLHWWWILYHWATREALIKINYNSYHNFKTYYTKIKISIKFPPVYIITFFLFSLFLSLFLFFITFLCCNETI